MKRLLLAAAMAGGLLMTGAPAAHACAWEYCPVTSEYCRRFECPIYCVDTGVPPVYWVCVL